MNDVLLISLVLAGSALSIAALVALNVMVGGWSPARLDDAEAAAGQLAADIIGFEPGERVCGAQGRAALVMERSGDRLGLVLARGDRFVTRAIRAGELRETVRRGATLELRFSDFTLPSAEITFPDERSAAAWAAEAQRFVASETFADARAA
ncbi:hypothetical protein DDZ18_13260 [Marinicauda salina]|uniref:Uncharacterized protein n=1 Tax=Marinicauda salina TaxID=2135793 RepID=A0A2U2BQW6_9PROT|nr:hypothetical protein [Marinicauda salina]PWE16386.1 hypothetical protein DDZ18_13260 [Marinicauda salina]